jgi:hypothetical protein
MKSVLVMNIEKIMAEAKTEAEAVATVVKKYGVEKVGAQNLINHIKRNLLKGFE